MIKRTLPVAELPSVGPRCKILPKPDPETAITPLVPDVPDVPELPDEPDVPDVAAVYDVPPIITSPNDQIGRAHV